MMMAFDSTPPPARLDDQTVAALRAAFTRYAGDGHDTRELRDALQRAAAEARTKGIRAEQLLLALKDVWYALPELGHASHRQEQQRLLQRLIARCLDEYFGP